MPSFSAKHVTRSHTIRLVAPPDQVFPLFTPEGERLWVKGWEPTILYPPDGAAQAGAVFITQSPGEASPTFWTIIDFEPALLRIGYIRLTPDSRLGRIAVQCRDNRDGTTNATISYTFTALTEAGNEYIEAFTEAFYQDYITSWETAINRYLRSDQPLQAG